MRKLTILLTCLLSACSSLAETIIVDPNGLADYTTIQDAINGSVGSDIIGVRPGIYYENVYFYGKAVTLTSTNPNEPNIVAQTIINGNQADSVVTFAWGEDANSIISGFTITNGQAQYGGGICCWGASPTIKNCVIAENHATAEGDACGGGIYGCAGLIQNCKITNNSAGTKGGGLCECNGIISGCTITDNSAVDYSGGGGGLSSCDANIIDCSITGNSASGYNSGGGGLYKCDGNITRCDIINNTTEYGWGGGLSLCNGSITDCNIIGNSAPKGSSGGLNECNGNIVNCVISYNSTSGVGGGLRDCGGGITNCTISNNISDAGGGLWNCDGKIDNCVINFNSTTEYSGGGLYRCDGEITNCIIKNNESFLSGGGLYNCEGTIKNCTITNNSAGENGAGIYFGEDYSPIIKNNIIVYNEGEGVYWKYAIPAAFTYNNVWSNANGDYAGWALPGEGDISDDPCFAALGYWDDPCNTPGDPTDDVWIEGDYHLQSAGGRWEPDSQAWVCDVNTSSCIDAGDPNSDWAEELWPHGAQINMGAYGGTPEAGMSLLVGVGNVADLNNDDTVDSADMTMFVGKWLFNETLLAEDIDRNGNVGFQDFAIFANEWFWQTP